MFNFFKPLLLNILTFIINVIFIININAESLTKENIDMATIVPSCDIVGAYDSLFANESSTCVKGPALSGVLRSVISGGVSLVIAGRTIMTGDTYGNCVPVRYEDKGFNGIFESDPLKYGMCNDAKLALEFAKSKADFVLRALQGEFINPFAEIPRDKYYDLKRHNLNSSPSFGAINYHIIKDADQICIAVNTLFGKSPIGCRYLEEPYKVSKYETEIMARDSRGNILTDDGGNPRTISGHSNYNNLEIACGSTTSCVTRAEYNSYSPINIGGPLIQCFREMVTKNFISPDYCSSSNANSEFDQNFDTKTKPTAVVDMSDNFTNQSFFYRFQQELRFVVKVLLIIYVIFLGYKITLANELLPKNEMITAMLKISLVMYFSVGVIGHDGAMKSGIQDWIMPFVLGAGSEIAGYIFNGVGLDGFCDYSSQDYSNGYEHLRIWDMIDCRIAYYLGMPVSALIGGTTNIVYFAPAVLAIFSGYILFLPLVIAFVILTISVYAYLLSSFIITLLGMAIILMLAPIYIPACLFNSTRNMFESWLRLLFGLILRPMVGIAMLTLMFSIFDYSFFKTCEINSVELPKLQKFLSGNDNKTFPFFYPVIPNNGNKEDDLTCKRSVGYMILPNFNDAKWSEIGSNYSELYAESVDNMGGVKKVKGVISDTFEFNKDVFKDLTIEFFTLVIFMVLFYSVAGQLDGFVTDLTLTYGQSQVIGAQSFVKGIKKAGNALNKLRNMRKKANNNDSGGDRASTSGSRADGATTSGGGDKVSINNSIKRG